MSETKEELKPYWDKDFKVDEATHNVKLYHYSAKSIAMVSDEVFGKTLCQILQRNWRKVQSASFRRVWLDFQTRTLKKN